jgi:hypothetical protein
MITWNLDPTLYTLEQLEDLLIIVQDMDFSIAKEIQEAMWDKNILKDKY